MKKYFVAILLFVSFLTKGQLSSVTYEWFSMSGGFLYSMEDAYTGLNGKINLPLGSHAKFVLQASLFPEQMQNPAEAYNEVSVLTLMPIWILALFCIFLGINTSLTVDLANMATEILFK